MREYGKVYTAFWTSDDVQRMTEDQRTLALYLLTCPHGNMLGCFKLPIAYVAEDLRWATERVEDALVGLIEVGYVYRSDKAAWTLIKGFLKWNQFENANVSKAAIKLFDALGFPGDVGEPLIEALAAHGKWINEETINRFKTQLKPFAMAFRKPSERLSVGDLKPSESESESLPETGAGAGAATRAGEGAKFVVSPGGGDEEDGTKPKKFHGTPDDHKTVKWMFERIRKVNATAREPNWDHWANDVRLMREMDGRSHSEICELFHWVGQENFWCTVILSPANLRQKWDQLVAKRNVPSSGRNGKPDNFVLGDVDHSSSQEAMKATMDRLGLETPPEGSDIKF